MLVLSPTLTLLMPPLDHAWRVFFSCFAIQVLQGTSGHFVSVAQRKINILKGAGLRLSDFF